MRGQAIESLRQQPAKNYLPVLLNGLHHPWGPVNNNAAKALSTLRPETAVPELINLLDAPDPAAPVEIDNAGKKTVLVREMVRLNHNKNCLLCHSPSLSRKDMVRVAVPSPGEPLPPRFSPAYYEDRSNPNGIFVRAEITYLRQEFSEIQTVDNPGNWPAMQRFDFLVRTRPLTEAELQARQQFVGPLVMPASQKAIVDTLRSLTGVDGGFTARSWKLALGLPLDEETPVVSKWQRRFGE